jgi:hypothetical protein
MKLQLQIWLEPVPDFLRDRAIEALTDANVVGFLSTAQSHFSMDLVFENAVPLRKIGLFEEALIHAFTATSSNNRNFPTSLLELMFTYKTNRRRLRAAGDPLPSSGPFTIYRGVAGRGRARRVRGLSWTASLEVAAWFAYRPELDDPSVYKVTVPEDAVLAYTNQRSEQEFIVLLPPNIRPKRIPIPDKSLIDEWKKVQSQKQLAAIKNRAKCLQSKT